ncbi:putative arsenite methyltransferase [Helianthus annuus]|nr:putative arsenite methyltransferase [Helianthus annuus]
MGHQKWFVKFVFTKEESTESSLLEHDVLGVTKFKTDALRYLEDNQDTSHRETLQGFIKSHGYSESFQKAYLVPMCYSIWPYPAEQILGFSAF